MTICKSGVLLEYSRTGIRRQREEAHQQAFVHLEGLKKQAEEERAKMQTDYAKEQAKWQQVLEEKEIELMKMRGNMDECKLEVANQVEIYKAALEASQVELDQFKESFHSLTSRVGHMM